MCVCVKQSDRPAGKRRGLQRASNRETSHAPRGGNSGRERKERGF